jgi:hypothetical protein
LIKLIIYCDFRGHGNFAGNNRCSSSPQEFPLPAVAAPDARVGVASKTGDLSVESRRNCINIGWQDAWFLCGKTSEKRSPCVELLNLTLER